MDAKEIKSFLNRVKKGLTKEYVSELVDAYLLSEHSANTLNAFDNLLVDDSLVSFPDRRACEKIISRLLKQHVEAGGSVQSFTESMTSNPSRISFNSYVIGKREDKPERTNRFGISVSGSNLFAVLNALIEKAEETGYLYDIEIPIMRELDQGIIDTIILYCSTEELGKTINFINSLGDEVVSKLSPNRCPIMHYTPSISYDVFNSEAQKWGRTIIGEALVASIDKVISDAVQKAEIPVTLTDANYFNRENDMTASYLYMKDKFLEAKLDFYFPITDSLTGKLFSMEIEPSNIFMSKEFIKNLYLVNNAAPQVTSPSGFTAEQVIQAKPAEITFEGEGKKEEQSHVLGEDDIPDLPAGITSTTLIGEENNTASGIQPTSASVPSATFTSTSYIKGPTMMLIPEMLERHHDDTDIDGLYQAFVKIKSDESKISSKVMQLNKIWPDLTYADFVAFRQYDKEEEFIPNGFIELWVKTKQDDKKDQIPSVSSEELYKPKAEKTEVVPAPVPEVPVTNLPPEPVAVPEVAAPVLNAELVPNEGQTLEVPPVPAPVPEVPKAPRPNPKSSKTARVMELISRGPQLHAEESTENIEAAPGLESVPAPAPEQTGSEQGFAEPITPATTGGQELGDELGSSQTGMYNDAPVEVQPLEDQSLTPSEAQAMMNVGANQNNEVDLSKYSFIPNAEVVLSQPVTDVDGSTMTLYNYFEKYNVLALIPSDSIVETPDGAMTAEDFITNKLSKYVVTNGAIGVEEYMELFNTHVVTPKDSTKKGLLSKILSGRKG